MSALTLRTKWERRKALFTARKLRNDAYFDFGPMQIANEAFMREVEALKATYGPRAANAPGSEGERLYAEAHDRMNRAERTAYQTQIAPTDRAAELLALTPAPDLDALAFKTNTIKMLEVYAWSDHDLYAVVAADAARLAGGVA